MIFHMTAVVRVAGYFVFLVLIQEVLKGERKKVTKKLEGMTIWENLVMKDQMTTGKYITYSEALKINPFYFKIMTTDRKVPIGMSWEKAAKWMDDDDNRSFSDLNFFSCSHIQDDGKCSIYEDRPSMCRSYPGKHFCGHNPDCDAHNQDEMDSNKRYEREMSRSEVSSERKKVYSS